jgi:hypothetical protein
MLSAWKISLWSFSSEFVSYFTFVYLCGEKVRILKRKKKWMLKMMTIGMRIAPAAGARLRKQKPDEEY